MRSQIGIVATTMMCAALGCSEPGDLADPAADPPSKAERRARMAATVEAARAGTTGAPLAGISAAAFNEALAAFNTDESITDGLGPLFSATSCGHCHTLGGIGGGRGPNQPRLCAPVHSLLFSPRPRRGGDAPALLSRAL